MRIYCNKAKAVAGASHLYGIRHLRHMPINGYNLVLERSSPEIVIHNVKSLSSQSFTSPWPHYETLRLAGQFLSLPHEVVSPHHPLKLSHQTVGEKKKANS